MNERAEIFKELEHLARYHSQAAHEFFGDMQTELAERINLLKGCLEEKAGTLDEIRRVIELLIATQGNLRKRVEDRDFLSSRMPKLRGRGVLRQAQDGERKSNHFPTPHPERRLAKRAEANPDTVGVRI